MKKSRKQMFVDLSLYYMIYESYRFALGDCWEAIDNFHFQEGCGVFYRIMHRRGSEQA